MSNLDDARRMLELAEQTAMKGDFDAADGLLRDAARIQEAELGHDHPDLANTLNSLAIVAEKTGRFGDAEAFYRRCAAVAAAALPADDPIVAESRKNLEDFCRERGLEAFPSTSPPAPSTAHVGKQESDSKLSGQPSRPALPKVSPVVHPPAPTASQGPASGHKRSLSALVWAGLAIVVVAIVVSISQRESSPEEPTAANAANQLETPAGAPSSAPDSGPPPAGPTPSETAPPAVAPSAAPSAPPSGSISMATVQLCQRFSTSGANWQCDPAGESPTQRTLVFYTRVKSARDAVVVHRWYKGDVLRQAVKLMVRANASEGFRTYSRQTVDDGAWRVEARSADGELLHEQRFTVR